MRMEKVEKVVERVKKVDDRIPVLWRKYPLVTIAVFLAGGVTGIVAVLIAQAVS